LPPSPFEVPPRQITLVAVLVGLVVAGLVVAFVLAPDSEWFGTIGGDQSNPATPVADAAPGISSGTIDVSVDTTLTTDHDGGIVIGSNNVILDCAGHAIVGPGRVGVGLFERSGVTLTNCIIEGFDIAIAVINSTGNILTGNDLRENPEAGITLVASSRNQVVGNQIAGSQVGINLSESSDNQIESNTVVGVGANWGIGMMQGSEHNVVTDNSTSRTESGILLATHAHENIITANTSSLNSKGFEATNSNRNTFEGNFADDNTFAGFWLATSDGSTAVDNHVHRGGFGFVIQASDRSTFESNVVSNSTSWFAFGISERAADNTFAHNEVTRGGVAFAVYIGAAHNHFVENTIEGSKKGFHISDAATVDNTITGNRVSHTTEIGFHDQTLSDSGSLGTANHYSANQCLGNANDSVPSGLCNQ